MFFALRPLLAVRPLSVICPWRLDTDKGVQGMGL
jgi:hypothetical protein